MTKDELKRDEEEISRAIDRLVSARTELATRGTIPNGIASSAIIQGSRVSEVLYKYFQSSLRKSLLVLCLFVGMWAFPTWAQTPNADTLAFPLDQAKITWDAGIPTDGKSWADSHIVSCSAPHLSAPVEVSVLMPSTTIALKSLLPGPGQYVCAVWGVNRAGRGPAASTPQFWAGSVPASVTNLRIEVQ